MKDRKLEINNIIKNIVKNKSIPYVNAINKIKKELIKTGIQKHIKGLCHDIMILNM